MKTAPEPTAELLATIPTRLDSRELRLYAMAGGGLWLGDYTRSRGGAWHPSGRYVTFGPEQLEAIRRELTAVEVAR